MTWNFSIFGAIIGTFVAVLTVIHYTWNFVLYYTFKDIEEIEEKYESDIIKKEIQLFIQKHKTNPTISNMTIIELKNLLDFAADFRAFKDQALTLRKCLFIDSIISVAAAIVYWFLAYLPESTLFINIIIQIAFAILLLGIVFFLVMFILYYSALDQLNKNIKKMKNELKEKDSTIDKKP